MPNPTPDPILSLVMAMERARAQGQPDLGETERELADQARDAHHAQLIRLAQGVHAALRERYDADPKDYIQATQDIINVLALSLGTWIGATTTSPFAAAIILSGTMDKVAESLSTYLKTAAEKGIK